MESPDDRFGMPDSALRAALDAHGANSPVIRLGMYVPTRREVATWAANKLFEVLIDWMWESPSDIIPDNKQISQVIEVLKAREDVQDPGVQRLIHECQLFLDA